MGLLLTFDLDCFSFLSALINKKTRMARPLGIEFAGALYNMTDRDNAQENIYCVDTDREQFLAPF